MRKRLKPQEAELLGFEPKENLPDGNAKYSINTKEWEKILDFRISQNKTKPIEESPNDELTKHKPFILSAWNNTNGKILDINEYCTVHNLPRQDVRSYKLITHTAIPYYNIQFRENVSEVDALQDLFTDEYFKEIAGKYIKPLDIISPNVGNSEYIDRLIISDVHIGMDNTGDLNTVPLYAKVIYDEANIFHRLNQVINHTVEHKKGKDLIIDNLGDFTDSLQGQTTRGGHALPQLLNDKQCFDIAVKFQVTLAESLLPFYENITFNNIINDNHSFLFAYFVHSAVKQILENKFPTRVTYNNHERFISHYSVGNHTFVITHGKDSKEMKHGMKLHLDAPLIEKLDQYCKHYGLYNGNNIEVSKGDLHCMAFDYTTSMDFEYMNYPAFSPPSNWVQTNFKNSKSGIVLQNVSLHTKDKSVIPKWF